jgi:hypothetical protein
VTPDASGYIDHVYGAKGIYGVALTDAICTDKRWRGYLRF